MLTLLQVATGGAIGAVLRWLVVLGAARLAGPGVPLGVLGINVAGSFAMGLAVVALSRSAHLPFVTVGVLGGFTTFSAFSLDAVSLIERGRLGAAALYMGLSVGLSVGALALGAALARGALGAGPAGGA